MERRLLEYLWHKLLPFGYRDLWRVVLLWRCPSGHPADRVLRLYPSPDHAGGMDHAHARMHGIHDHSDDASHVPAGYRTWWIRRWCDPGDFEHNSTPSQR